MHVSFDRSLNTAVNALRRALGDTSRNARYIETRTGLGYVFLAAVEEVGTASTARAETAIQLVHSNAASADPPQDCLKGRYFCHKLTEEDWHKGVAHFNAALVQYPRLRVRLRGTGGRLLPVRIAEHGAGGRDLSARERDGVERAACAAGSGRSACVAGHGEAAV